MEQELNIAAILKDKPKGTKLYDTARCVSVAYQWVDINSKIIHGLAENKYLIYERNGSLIGYPKGALILKPSKQMQDWSKFAWKKGDVLNGGVDSFCIFDKWSNDDYTEFEARYITPTYISANVKTNMYTKANDIEKTGFIKEIEKYFGGKLSLETLEIEKPEPQFKDGDIVYSPAGDIMDEAIFIAKVVSKGVLHNYIYMSKEDMIPLANSSFGVSGSLHNIRLATDSEKQQLFDALAKEGKRWNPETKTLEDLPKECEFKAMDWCLMRDVAEIENKKVATSEWALCQFSHYLGDYKIAAVGGNWFSECIPYNEQTKHLLGTTDDYEK